jgi:hypothetical protein
MFADYWQTKVAEDQYEHLGQMLGLIWKRSDMDEAKEKMNKVKRRAPDEIFIPLTVAIEPSITEQVKKMFGSTVGILPPNWVKAADVVNLYDVTEKDEFLNFVKMFVRPKLLGKGVAA